MLEPVFAILALDLDVLDQRLLFCCNKVFRWLIGSGRISKFPAHQQGLLAGAQIKSNKTITRSGH